MAYTNYIFITTSCVINSNRLHYFLFSSCDYIVALLILQNYMDAKIWFDCKLGGGGARGELVDLILVIHSYYTRKK